MSFHVADAVTGRTLREGAPVVAFLVQSQHDTYPLQDAPNRAATRPSGYFALASLPIFGRAADCGQIEVYDEKQLGVRLALLMTGTESWQALMDTAFGKGDSVQFMGRPNPTGETSRTNSRMYGLCLLHLETYLHLVDNPRTELASRLCFDGFDADQLIPANRAENVRSTIDVLDKCRQSPFNRHLASTPADSNFHAHFRLMTICSLRAEKRELEQALDKMPEFTGLLSTYATASECYFGSDFRTFSHELPGMKAEELLSLEGASLHDHPDLAKYLTLLWDCIHLGDRMYDIHAFFKPSAYAGQDWSAPSLLDLANGTLPGLWAELVGLEVDHNEKEASEGLLDKEIARLEATVATMRGVLSKARASRADRWS